jgi:EAL and modified HD-GYP domain-containing signal transduction protein
MKNEAKALASEAKTEEHSWKSVFVAAQPIFDLKGAVWGYEMLYRDAEGAAQAVIDNPEQATAHVIVDGLAVAVSEIPPGCKALINFTQDMLLAGLAKALPAERCIIEILEDVQGTKEVIAACRELKKLGYGIAMDDYDGRDIPPKLLELVDIIKVEVPMVGAGGLKELIDGFAGVDVGFLAEKIEDEETDMAARMAGFSLFQGYFYAKPKIMHGKKIEPATTARIRILQQAAGGSYDVDAISSTIASDVSLTHRLLKFMNAVSRSGGRKVKSIPEAVMLIGSDMLKFWLMAVTLSDLNPAKNVSPVIHSSILRAFFLSMLPGLTKMHNSRDTLFLIGLLSQLDTVLGVTMQEALEQMPLEEDVTKVLLKKQEGMKKAEEAFAMLQLIISLERGDWRSSFALLEDHGIDRKSTSKLFADARRFAVDILQGM